MRLRAVLVFAVFAAAAAFPAGSLSADGATQLLYSSYAGGEYDDFAQAIAVDGEGNFWVGGTGDDLFPAIDSNNGDGPSFVRKYDRNGVPLFTNYFLGLQPNPGRSYVDWIGGIAVDAQGNAYIAGSADERFPATVRPPQPCPEDDRTVFLVKMSPTGSILYSTMLCGGGGLSPAHAVRGVAVDSNGNAYVVGYTASEHFTTTPGALIRTIPSDKPGSHYNDTGFVAKFGPAGALIYSTYLGGGTADRAWAVAADAAGNAYVTGESLSMDFPVVGGLGRPWYNIDAFVAKLNPSGTALVYSTFLGGLGFDYGFGIDVDASGAAFVAGRTTSGAPEIPDGYRFPVTAGAAQAAPAAQGTLIHDGFVAKLNPAGNAVVYATYLGGNGDDEVQAVAVDDGGNAWVTGYTTSSNLPLAGATQASLHGHSDAFVAKVSASGGAFLFLTYHGGGGAENDERSIFVKQYTRSGIALESAGNAYVTGYTDSTDFPLKAAYQDKNYGSSPGKMQDAFVAIFGAEPAPPRPPLPFRVVIPFLTRN